MPKGKQPSWAEKVPTKEKALLEIGGKASIQRSLLDCFQKSHRLETNSMNSSASSCKLLLTYYYNSIKQFARQFHLFSCECRSI